MPSATLAPSAAGALEAARPVHARWSALNGALLDHAGGDPAWLDRGTFASLSSEPWARSFDLQPWPLFADASRVREVEAVALGMDRLMKSTLSRFLAGGLERARAFYRFERDTPHRTPRRAILGNDHVLPLLLEEPSGIRGAPSRADWVEDAGGLKCIEFNAGGFLGATQIDALGEMYLRCPPIARFLAEHGAAARAPDTTAAFFRHQVDETVRLGAWRGGEFNAAVVALPNEPEIADRFVESRYTDALGRALAERGMPGGRAIVCAPGDFHEEGGVLLVNGSPVHLVMEHHDRVVSLRLQFRHFKTGRVNLVSGPIGHLLSDNGSLALVSENAASDDYTAAERAFIERHVPWTRRLLPARTTFRGRGLRLPDDLVERRPEFVLKKSCSAGGSDVLVGRYRSDAEWRDDLARASREEDWVVQEYLEPLPYCFQAGERGAARHDLVWGLFAFGDHFGGALLRMQPHGGSGVVNTHRGARVGVLLELEP